MTYILPSIASAEQSDLSSEIRRLKNHPYLHFDIEDGNFVKNISFGMRTVRALRPLSSADFDAHLMVTDPMDYIPTLLEQKFTAIAFHWESTGYPMRVINAIRDGGCRVGIALNPRTRAEEIFPYLSAIDYVLLMSAEPDGHGDEFQPAVLEKIRALHREKETMPIIVDGAVNEARLPLVRGAGACAVVMGRAVFSSPDPFETVRRFSAF